MRTKKNAFLFHSVLALGAVAFAAGPGARPNIVYILADDIGIGDVSCFNPDSKLKTPHLDRLAREGMIFTDAHSTSAVCTPSRYSILTGRYNWRSALQSKVLRAYDPSLIPAGRLTVPGFLRQHGYHTAGIGKWHLGLNWAFDSDEGSFICPPNYKPLLSDPGADVEATAEQKVLWREAFSKPIAGGPLHIGFDYYFGVNIPNGPPYCFIENDRTVGIPSEFLPVRLTGGNILGSMSGPAMPYWNFEQLLPVWVQKADWYIRERVQSNQPFFLYLALTSPHTPLSVNTQWIGKSGLNSLYADLVLETDDVVGRILDSLDRHGVAGNTLVVFTSDNGCASYIGVTELEAQGHYPSGPYRGYKSDVWEGGHRVPFIVRWPGVVAPESRCDQLVCQSDLLATCAELLGSTLPDDAGEDSISMMPLLRGGSLPVRDHIVHHSFEGKFAVRKGRWKLLLCAGSGAWTYRDAEAAAAGLPPVQLYDLQEDPAEQKNLQAEHPEKVMDLLTLLEKLVAEGRSTPGPLRTNDVPVDVWKNPGFRL